MPTILTVHDHIMAARDYTEYSREALRNALKSASAVEGLIILDLINQISNVRSQLFNLADAVKP